MNNIVYELLSPHMNNYTDPEQFRRTISKAIALPVILALLLSAGFIGIIFHLMSVTQLADHSNQVIALAHENLQLSINSQTGVRGFLITGNETLLEPHKKAQLLFEKKIAELRTLVSDNSGQVRRLEDIAPLYQLWDQYATRVMNLKRNKLEYVGIVASETGEKIVDNIRQRFADLIAIEEGLRDERLKDTAEVVRLALILILSGSLITGLFLAYFSRRQLMMLSTTYGAILQKQTEQNKALAAEEWVQTGMSELTYEARGDQSLEELCSKVLSYISHRLAAKVGSIYSFQDSDVLHRVSSFAFSAEAEQNVKTLKLGESLVGQAALENRTLILNDIPENYININSSSGSAKPRNLILLPLATDKEVYGVLELGFFESLPSEALEYLNRASESIGLFIKSAKYRARLKELLEESQVQSEELQAQQEELRTNNEELEEQGNAQKESQVRLESQQAELEQINSQLEQQSSELERQSKIVSAKNEELEKNQVSLEQKAHELEMASQYKSQFLANMSHELRTPLNSTLILAQLLVENKKGKLGPEELEFSKTILSSCNDLLTLINDILDLSKVEAGKIDLNPESIEIKNFADSLKRVFEPMAKDKKIGLRITLDNSIPHFLETDRQRLEQILKNLLSNAIKFTAEGSVNLQISSRAEKGNDRIYFAVTDTGIGISSDQKEDIFGAFKQADGTTSRKYGGTGLGLTISRDLARLLGGDISVSSEVGKGSTFTLLLPRVFVPLREMLKEATEPENNKIQQTKLVEAKQAPLEKKVFPRKKLSFVDDRNQLKENFRMLLVVEDDSGFAKIIFDLGHEMKFNCLVAQSAAEGIEDAETYLPHAVILDINLPDHSGLTVLDALKANPKTRHIPVHIVTAQDQSNTILEMGAIGFLRKPVSINDLRGAIAKLEATFTKEVRQVLVVEDNKVQRESVTLLIQDESVKVTGVETADQALQLLQKKTFDCMILDLNLPDMSGHELLEKIAQMELDSRPPVIIYTGKDISPKEETKLQKYSRSIILKGAHSPERLLSEVSLFLHQVESSMSLDRQKILQELRDREKIFETKKILIVDDDVRNIFALSSALEGKGAIIETAKNGREAVEKVKNDLGIDLVLMDIMMPEMDGYEAMRLIRKDSRFSKLPIIAVTAKAMVDDQEKCLEAGANDYLAKPINLSKLLSLLRVWISQSPRKSDK